MAKHLKPAVQKFVQRAVCQKSNPYPFQLRQWRGRKLPSLHKVLTRIGYSVSLGYRLNARIVRAFDYNLHCILQWQAGGTGSRAPVRLLCAAISRRKAKNAAR